MPSTSKKGLHLFVLLACMVMFFLIVTNRELPKFPGLLTADLAIFRTLFLSIVLEAIPFILLGVFVSALLQTFVSEEMVRKWTPKNPLLGVLFGCSLGIIFPICECGMILVVRRLLLKGMPLYIAVIFLVAAPVINPVVYSATFMAFRTRPDIVYSRLGLTLLVAVVVGLIVYRFVKYNALRISAATMSSAQQNSQQAHANQGSKWVSTFSHASDEFFEMGKYLLFGAMLTALIQTFVSREHLVAIGQGEWSSHLFMMGFAYILSICSTSDAFVAASFTTLFTSGSLVTFLVYGPIVDLKNTLLMLSVFRAKFVLLFIALVSIAVLSGSLILERWLFQ